MAQCSKCGALVVVPSDYEFDDDCDCCLDCLHESRHELLSACRAALDAMINQRYMKPRVGMENPCEQCATALVNAGLSLPPHLSHLARKEPRDGG